MKNKSILNKVILFILFIALISTTNNIIKNYLINNGIDDYNIHLAFNIISKSILGLVSFMVAKRLDLIQLGGLSKTKPKKLWLVIFPLLFLVLLNIDSLDSIPNFSILNISLLVIYCIVIGISEELSLRSVLLPLISKYFGNNRKAQIKAVFISALIFGFLHLINFDKGIYGEIAQLFFATFIGIMFGALLLVIKRVYPLIIIHAIIDFVAKLDSINKPVKAMVYNPMDINDSILTILITLPCLIYGLYIIKKQVPVTN
ncbi:CPBP family intramembrane glutamic endopeptidase [uncultured Polaribacter sp.]|uniref:CPBP family intramembrane glutamic endopeptidase n=1 Tax=uncultured Polaribacter sp. TaxID=174711 RepID=UPI002638C303|nr:CPBP family intramembrane glutamic endopeptidase [uncultured Polaribacter sp.]